MQLPIILHWGTYGLELSWVLTSTVMTAISQFFRSYVLVVSGNVTSCGPSRVPIEGTHGLRTHGIAGRCSLVLAKPRTYRLDTCGDSTGKISQNAFRADVTEIRQS